MSKELLEELAFEKSKREILKQNSATKPENQETKRYEKHNKFAWEIELENYRKSKAKERFYFFGAMCGILSLFWNILMQF
ncbi:MAG TPA: hypothetical protein DCS67_10910 [Clostridiales bacterium UBA8960]|jgi:hypothetical protein|nr:hypothetical protein [Clostridiales bacterium UBA8960]